MTEQKITLLKEHYDDCAFLLTKYHLNENPPFSIFAIACLKLQGLLLTEGYTFLKNPDSFAKFLDVEVRAFEAVNEDLLHGYGHVRIIKDVAGPHTQNFDDICKLGCAYYIRTDREGKCFHPIHR